MLQHNAFNIIPHFCRVTWYSTTIFSNNNNKKPTWNQTRQDTSKLFTCPSVTHSMCERVSHTSVSQNVSLSSPGAPPLSPPPSDRCHLCIVCVRRDCSRHFPLWLAFTQCNQCCSCLKRPLVQHLSNARFPDASTTLLVAPFRLGDKRQTVWRACVKPLDLPLCLTALALFWTRPSVVYGLTVLVKIAMAVSLKF